MNGIDHTDLEVPRQTQDSTDEKLLLNNKVLFNKVTGRQMQDSTGQVGHYFGKLLLNNFGGWAQTFIEAPHMFTPVLGRLDRLNITWSDRHGNALTASDIGAGSCEWHMTLRITEIVEVPMTNSSLVQSGGRRKTHA